MTGWQDSRSINRRHEHTVATSIGGRDICYCGQQIFKPITSSDDPRLETAGFMRSGEEEGVYFCSPLPLILIALHEEGPEYGFVHAPIAPYLTIIAMEQSRRHDDDVDIWTPLSQLV